MAQKEKLNRWKGLTVGLVGGLAGVYAMRYYWKHIAPELFPEQANWDANPASESNNAISLVGQHYEAGEPATAALGRRMYEVITGQEPQSAEMKRLLADLTGDGASWPVDSMVGRARERIPGTSRAGSSTASGCGWAMNFWPR